MPGAHAVPRARLRGPAGWVALASAAAVGWVLLALGSSPEDRPTAAARADRVAALEVLRQWDRSRAAAWARGDVRALRRLYLPASVAGERDAAMLRRWAARGLRVDGLAMQVLSVVVVEQDAGRLVLEVEDRVADTVAVRAGPDPDRLRLPRDAVTTRRIAFRNTSRGWVVAAVRAVPG